MDAERLDIDKTLRFLTLDEKINMLSGSGMWHTFGAGELPRARMADGPNGLRMTDGVDASAIPSTCYPTPSMLANSWDPALLYNVGAAIGREATAMGVNVLLAPGLNIKRNALGGRNFEYYSEDPLLNGELGKAFVLGVQSTGVGACVKHFAANNRETARMYSDSVTDARALREIYLKPFKIALDAEPVAVMCAYNKSNGKYCSENDFLLKSVLRDEWDYRGVTVSDWGAVHNRSVSLAAGLDLAMPYSPLFADDVRSALDRGEISEDDIDAALRRILELVDNVYLEPYGDYDGDAHDKLSYNAAVESVVLLKNDNGFLPLTKNMRVAVIGAYAENAPVQGGGSSHVTPLKYLSPLDAFAFRSVEVSYFRGYGKNAKENKALYEEALAGAALSDAVVVYVGVPAPHEGADRTELALPPEQNDLITGLTNAGHRVVVVLCTPGAVQMPWINRVRAVVYAGLNGQNGATAAIDVLFGRINPRGKLAETFPLEETAPSASRRDLYKESIFVGYRYYDSAEKPVLFPFGHGLSFSDISYDGMRVKRMSGNEFVASVTLTNNSTRDAYETVQIYVSDRTGRIMCAAKQLAGFKKVHVEGKTSTVADIKIGRTAFEFFNTDNGEFNVSDGEYKIMCAASSADIKHEISVKVDGDYFGKTDVPPSYKLPLSGKFDEDDFKTLYGSELPPDPAPAKRGEFTLDNCIEDMSKTAAGKAAAAVVRRKAKAYGALGSPERNAFIASAMGTPLSAVAAMSDGSMSVNAAKGLVEAANGKIFKGLKLILKKN